MFSSTNRIIGGIKCVRFCRDVKHCVRTQPRRRGSADLLITAPGFFVIFHGIQDMRGFTLYSNDHLKMLPKILVKHTEPLHFPFKISLRDYFC